MAALRPGGVFSWVAERAREPYAVGNALDLGLRASPKKPGAGGATLYRGTTQVLNLDVRRDGRFRLRPHQKGGLFVDVKPPFEPSWSVWQPLESLGQHVDAVRAHVADAIRKAPESRMGEGRHQAALSKPNALGFTLVDREVQPAFADTPAKDAWMEEQGRPLLTALRELASTHHWAPQKKGLGGELDALAIAQDGRLLAIEVKPGNAGTLPWTPLQVAMYARMLRAWIGVDPSAAKTVIERMASQRAELGLTAPDIPRLPEPIDVVPVIAIGMPLKQSKEMRSRFSTVRETLRRAGEPLSGLELWTIDDGDVQVSDATELEQLIA